MVMVPLPWASSKTVPWLEPPAHAVPYRLPLLSMIRRGMTVCAVAAVERRQRGDGATSRGQLENRAVAEAPPP